MSWPIYIPSKGRALTMSTPELLKESGVPFKIVVEPQDYDAYKNANPETSFMVLAKDNQGIGFVRQSILDWARNSKDDWFWMMDDDITGFFKAVNGRNVKTSIDSILSICELNLERTWFVGQAALEYQQYSWSAKKDYTWNSYCDVCVAINTTITKGIDYRSHMDLKEDRDFTLQILANAGLKTVRFSKFSFSAPKNGSNKGGLYQAYQQTDRELEAVNRMVKAWPGICSLNIKKDGRTDVKINWKLFKDASGLLPE